MTEEQFSVRLRAFSRRRPFRHFVIEFFSGQSVRHGAFPTGLVFTAECLTSVVAVRQNRISPPCPSSVPLAVANVLPSGENAAQLTVPVCPTRLNSSCMVATSQSFSSSGLPPLAKVLPSGEKAKQVTPP